MKWIAALLLCVACSEGTIVKIDLPTMEHKPLFKEGDCIRDSLIIKTDNEFTEDKITDLSSTRRILKVGKRNYLYKYNVRFNLQSEQEIDVVDYLYKKIDCPEGL